MYTWSNLFKMESMKYCLIALMSTIILVMISYMIQENGYGLCIINAAILGSIVLYDSFHSHFSGMEELLKCVKLNEARIFVYKSNIYLFVNIVCSLVLNAFVSFQLNCDFMNTLLYSLVPTYLISGLVLFIVDKIENKISIMILYLGCYLFAGFFLFANQIKIPPALIIFILIISFGWYSFNVTMHVHHLKSERSSLLWN